MAAWRRSSGTSTSKEPGRSRRTPAAPTAPYQDEWYGELGFTLGESAGETLSQVLAVAEWWDITGLRHQPRDFDAFWAKGGLTIDLETCQETLEEA